MEATLTHVVEALIGLLVAIVATNMILKERQRRK